MLSFTSPAPIRVGVVGGPALREVDTTDFQSIEWR
jgi:hypothetical protein